MFRTAIATPVVCALALGAGLIAAPAAAQDSSVTITTLEWPPYTSPALPLGGAVTEIVIEAFANSGISAEVMTLPWQRAIVMADEEEAMVGYFPGYHCRHMDGFIASDPIGFGPLGLVENTEAPISWGSIDDLGEQQLLIGTVLGYANTDEFDEKAGTGWIRAVPAPDDATNLRKLVRQRIDAAVIDRFVLSYLLATRRSPTVPGKSGSMSVLWKRRPSTSAFSKTRRAGSCAHASTRVSQPSMWMLLWTVTSAKSSDACERR